MHPGRWVKWNMRKNNNEPPAKSLTARLENLDQAADAIGAAIGASGGKARRIGHKTVEIELPGKRAKLRLVISPYRRMTPRERADAEKNVEVIQKRARATRNPR